jgi:homoserine kinase
VTGVATRAARVRVPCSTSNLGAGFDCVGVALDRWLEAEVRVGDARAPAGVTIARGGTLAALGDFPAEDDYVTEGFRAACAYRGVDVPRSLAFRMRSEIPVARGLGSSAVSLVAGAMLAGEALGLGLAPADHVTIGADFEGHPDNVAPIVLGGAVLAVPGPHGWAWTTLEVHPSLGIALAVPDFETSTREMRAALPPTVPYKDAVLAAGKAASLVRGLVAGDPALLAHALDDVLHVPYRRAFVRGYDDVVRAALGAGAFGATLSGSGSTVLALAPHARIAAVCDAMRGAWEASGVRADAAPARLAPAATVG